jgi:hypothetical protein
MTVRLFKICLAISILIGIFQTYRMVPNHFTQIDDIGVAESLMIRNLDYRDKCELNLPTIQGRLLSWVYRDKQKVCKKLVQLNRLTIIPSLWTYAPVQFWFTQALLHPDVQYSYEEVKWRGRLPSFIFYLLGVFGFYWMLLKSDLGFRAHSALALSMTAIIIFSLEERIHAAQMHSYAIGILSNVLIIWSLSSLRNIKTKSYGIIGLLTLCIALGVGMQYQGMLLVISGLLAIGFYNPIDLKNKSFAIRYAYFIALLAGLIYLVAGNFIGMSNRAINWNAGPHGEFIVQGNNWQEKAIDFTRLISNYSAENLYAITSAIELNNFGAQIFGGVMLVLCLLGVMYLCLKAKDDQYRFILLFISTFFVTYFSLVILGKLTFSPTRHLLYFLPIIALLLGYGIIFILSYVSQRFLRMMQLLLGFLLLFYLIASIMLFFRFYEQRIDHIKENYFSRLSLENDASFLVFDGNDIEPLFSENKNISKYWYASGGFSCSHIEMLITEQKKLKFLFYSKERMASLEDSKFIQYINDIIGHCTTHSVKEKKIKKITQIAKVIEKDGTAIEFGNKVTNVHNKTFIQLFEIQTNFSSNLYPATLEQGIDFSQKSYPRFLKYVAGLAGAEFWGRWSDANQGKQIYLGFREPLPNKFTLELTAKAYGENSQYPTIIRIGQETRELIISNDQKTYQVVFDSVNDADVIEVIPPRPASIQPNSEETRRLGIGLVELKIRTH